MDYFYFNSEYINWIYDTKVQGQLERSMRKINSYYFWFLFDIYVFMLFLC